MPPAIKDLKTVKVEQKIAWQQGQLVCHEVLEGADRHEFTVETVDTRYRLTIHDKVPFGVAGARLETKSNDGIKGTIQYWLTDMGTNATSDLPDQK
jgi:hypothetical protein